MKNRSADSGALDLTGESTVRTSSVVAVPIDKAFEDRLTLWQQLGLVAPSHV